MKEFYKDLWLRYSFLIICASLVVLAAITIGGRTARRQANDPKLIALAVHQNMITQRITQLAGQITENQTQPFIAADVDTLRENITRLRDIHRALSAPTQTREAGQNTHAILRAMDPLVNQVYEAGQILQAPDPETRKKALLAIRKADPQLKLYSRQLVSEYQQRAESNINEINRVIIGIGLVAFMVLVGASFISRDVTRLKEIQNKLRNSEKLYRLLSTNSHDLISLYNNTGDEPIRIYVSPSLKPLLGYEPEEVLLRSPLDFVHPDDAAYVKKEIESAAQKGEAAYVEYRNRKKDGSYVWMESSAQPFFNDDGQQIGFQTSARDITQRKEAESRLKEAKEKAEEATRAKSQLLSMISHEIRTPMNGVIGLTNFLLDDEPREDQLRHLKLLKFSGENLLAIINDMLDFSKIEAGKIALEHIAIEFKSFIDNVLETLQPRASDKGVPLILKYDENLPPVLKGDPVRLHQILNNLVGNAIKFTDTGFVHVTILSLGKTENAHLVQIAIQDTGIGIRADKLQTIFEPFTQASTDTTRKYGGTGLGLAITKRLLEHMGATIHAESEPGKGSTFSFTLALEEASHPREEKTKRQNINYSRVPNAHLLLVEDNDVNQVVAANYLGKWGFQVTIAANGKEAVDKIRQQAFHLVLMDLQMPELDGYTATQRIRQMPEEYFRQVPIIALTASAVTENISNLEAIGFNDYITKPIHPHELEEKIFKNMLATVPSPKAEAPAAKTLLDAFWGVDPETNIELARRMVKNIQSLQQAFNTALLEEDIELFNRACHKMKTTIGILKDKTFALELEELRKAMMLKADLATQLQHKMDRFAHGCNRKIEELNRFIEETTP